MRFWNIPSVIGFFLSGCDGKHRQRHGKESSDKPHYMNGSKTRSTRGSL